MRSKNLIICDAEEDYAKALAAFFLRKKEMMLQVQVCSSIEHAAFLGEKLRADILLVSPEYAPEVRQKIDAEKVILLSAGNMHGEYQELPVLYKYQPGEKLLNSIIRECAEIFEAGDVVRGVCGNRQQKIIGVFSPVHRIGKTAYALSLGEDLAESENVLYMNLEIYEGLGGHFEQNSQTLADVIYYAGQEKGNLGLMLTTLVCHRGNLDYIQPVPVSEDIKGIRGTEWGELANKILEQSIYDTLVLDIGDFIPELYKLLKCCTELHMLILEDEYSRAKILQFEQEMHLLGQEDILKKIIRKGGNA